MKSRYICMFACLWGLGFLFSCDGFLNENPKDKIPEEDAYKNLTDLYYNAVASLYNNIGGYSDSQGLQGTGRGIYDLNTFTTDEAIMPTRGGDWYDGGFWQGLFLHRWEVGSDAIQATWEYLYKVVSLCNQSLERINTYQQTHNDEELPVYRAGGPRFPCFVLLSFNGFVCPCPFGSFIIHSFERSEAEQSQRSFRFCSERAAGV